MKIKPVGERVLVKPIQAGVAKTESGIVLTGTVIANEKPTTGVVLAVGSGENVKDITEGKTIVFTKYSGTEIIDGDDKLLLLNADDILGFVEDEE